MSFAYLNIIKALINHNIIREENIMLYSIAIVLIILWILGMVSAYTIGGLIHILLVIAVVAILLRLIKGKKPII